MDIDISIRNATQDELRQLFKGLLTPVRVGTAANFQSERWSPEEKDAIAGCTDSDEAWESYHERFPDSSRTQDAVRRMYQNVRGEVPPATTPALDFSQSTVAGSVPSLGTEPVMVNTLVMKKEPVPSTTKEPAKIRKQQVITKLKRAVPVNKGEKKGFDIPFSWKTQKPEYNKAYHLCKKYGKPYPEALKLKEDADAAERQKKPEKATESLQSDPGPAPARHITRGDKVRHITAYPLFPGVGTVVKTSTNGKEVMVDFGNGTEWLDRKNLELVPGEAKAT